MKPAGQLGRNSLYYAIDVYSLAHTKENFLSPNLRIDNRTMEASEQNNDTTTTVARATKHGIVVGMPLNICERSDDNGISRNITFYYPSRKSSTIAKYSDQDQNIKPSIYAVDVPPAVRLPSINRDEASRNYHTMFYSVGESYASSCAVLPREPDCISSQSSMNDVNNKNDGALDGALVKTDTIKALSLTSTRGKNSMEKYTRITELWSKQVKSFVS